MKRVWVAAICLLWIVAMGGAPLASTAPQTELEEEALRILNRSCTTCHDLGPIQMRALEGPEWARLVSRMMDNGADLEMREALLLLDYLLSNHGPLPEGAGRALLLDRCTICHNLRRVKERDRTPDAWRETLETMLNEGASLTETELPVVLDYLSTHFGPPEE